MRRLRRLGRRGTIVAAVAAAAAAAAAAAYASFWSTGAANSGNSFATGTVVLADNDTGAALLSLSNAVPTVSDTASGCITVSYTGSLTANVHIYASAAGTGLASYLNVTITRGSFSSAPAFPSCTTFTADSTTYITGQAQGVIYNGTLTGLGTTYAGGAVDPTASSPASWTNGTSHVYKVQIKLQDNLAARGLNANGTQIEWEAQNT